ncbi:MAG TPA: hypothetical protein VKY89_01340 [Thermoanaerobaculia bacterium]|jgi:hypothetical protein|nr:hypothetical protein [Thermoanaerobaculia bacterium]
MKNLDLNRRDLGRLTAAALGGAIAGSLLGGRALHAAEAAAPDSSHWLKDPHLCCGLNACKGHGKGASNDCAGMGHCATVEAHGCAGENACAGQGSTGENGCKGKGSCAVPVTGDGWKKARTTWEQAMTKAGKKFGAAPKECGGGA